MRVFLPSSSFRRRLFVFYDFHLSNLGHTDGCASSCTTRDGLNTSRNGTPTNWCRILSRQEIHANVGCTHTHTYTELCEVKRSPHICTEHGPLPRLALPLCNLQEINQLRPQSFRHQLFAKIMVSHKPLRLRMCLCVCEMARWFRGNLARLSCKVYANWNSTGF